MATTIKHNGRLAGWTDDQIKAYKRITTGALRGRLVMAGSIAPGTLNPLTARHFVVEIGGKLQLTTLGLAAAKECGWIKPHES